MPHNPTTDEILGRRRREHRVWLKDAPTTHLGFCSCGYYVSLAKRYYDSVDVVMALAAHQSRNDPATRAKRDIDAMRTREALERIAAMLGSGS